MLRIHEIKLKPGEELTSIPEHIKKKLGMKRLEIAEWTLIKESIDARDKQDIRMVYSVDFTVGAAGEEQDAVHGKRNAAAAGENDLTGLSPAELSATGLSATELSPVEQEVLRIGQKRKIKIAVAADMQYHFVTDQLEYVQGSPEDTREVLTEPPAVVGFGPCGMFCALLLAQMGYRPIVLERGKAIEERVEDVERFWKEGVLDPNSNVQFGEGGAGSFSDGKLTTQIKDKRIRKVLEELAAAGGGQELLYKQKPHVGTDILRDVVKNIRAEILRLGGRIEFQNCVTGLVMEDGGRQLAGLKLSNTGQQEKLSESTKVVNTQTQTLPTRVAVLALGHSARDTFRELYAQGVPMEQKPFSMGVRIEHPQRMINEAQYGKDYEKYQLGAADYKLSYRCKNGRGVYTFCMCPGGQVIASASQEGGVVTNGMSYRDRGLENANSALLADVRTEDFGSDHPLAGIAFQEKYERLAFEAGGRTYRAPAQRAGDFLSGTVAEEFATVQPSYEPGVTWTALEDCLPDFVTESLREALPELAKKLKGFDRPDAVLTALESRSSSPVRIPRGEELTCGIQGLYPGGEGAGFAGGITSAAVDGIKLAEAIALKYRPAQPSED